MGNTPSFKKKTVMVHRYNMSEPYILFDCPFSQLGLFNFTDKEKHDAANALKAKGYDDDYTKRLVDYIDNVIITLKPISYKMDDVDFVWFVNDKGYNLLMCISLGDVKRREERKTVSHFKILRIDIPYLK